MKVSIVNKSAEDLPADAVLIPTTQGITCHAFEKLSDNPLFQYEIHVKFPQWTNGKNNEKDEIATAYKNALLLLRRLDAISLTIPGDILSGYPISESVAFLTNAIEKEIAVYPELDTIFIACSPINQQ